MLPQDARDRLDRIIVLTDNCKPVFADKIQYYSDQAMDRLLPPMKVARWTWMLYCEGRRSYPP
jgi:type IV secretory pathway TraG/TraD family ATPase VirD4